MLVSQIDSLSDDVSNCNRPQIRNCAIWGKYAYRPFLKEKNTRLTRSWVQFFGFDAIIDTIEGRIHLPIEFIPELGLRGEHR